MGLIYNLLIGVIHLLFVVMDILFVMILIRVVYHRWRPECLRQINNTVEPLVSPVLAFVDEAATLITRKSLSEKYLVLAIVVSLSVMRFVICGLF